MRLTVKVYRQHPDTLSWEPLMDFPSLQAWHTWAWEQGMMKWELLAAEHDAAMRCTHEGRKYEANFLVEV